MTCSGWPTERHAWLRTVLMEGDRDTRSFNLGLASAYRHAQNRTTWLHKRTSMTALDDDADDQYFHSIDTDTNNYIDLYWNRNGYVWPRRR